MGYRFADIFTLVIELMRFASFRNSLSGAPKTWYMRILFRAEHLRNINNGNFVETGRIYDRSTERFES